MHQVHFTIECEDGSKRLNGSSFHFTMPESIHNFDAIHPDRWALVLVMAAFQYASTIHLSFSVSKHFHDAMLQAEIIVTPVSDSLSAFDTDSTPGAKPGVAFSGGPHSFIAAAIMGSGAALVAIDHQSDGPTQPPSSISPPDGMYYAMDVMMSRGYTVKTMRTNIQSLFDPAGFEFGLLAGAGVVLLGQFLSVRSVCYGSQLSDLGSLHPSRLAEISFQNGPALRIGSGEEDGNPLSLAFWRGAFRSVGLELDFPTCGMSDYLAMKLLSRHKMLPSVALCSKAYPPCECCVDCIYYSMLVTMQTTHIPFEKAWDKCSFECSDMCVSHGRFAYFWVLLLTRKDAAPKKLWNALSMHRKAAQANKGTLHPGTMDVASYLNRSQIDAGWQRLLS